MTPYVIATITKENYKEFFPNGDPFLKTDSVDEANRGK
jgi:hypothetical protein